MRVRMAAASGPHGGRVGGIHRSLQIASPIAVHSAGGPVDHPGAGQGHALPCPGLGRMIVAERGEADGDRAFVARRAQPHVHGVERAVHAGRGEGGDHGMGGANEILAGRQACAGRCSRSRRGRDRRSASGPGRSRPSSPARRPCRARTTAMPPPWHRRRSRSAWAASTRGSSTVSAASANAGARRASGVRVQLALHLGDREPEFLAPHGSANEGDGVIQGAGIGQLGVAAAPPGRDGRCRAPTAPPVRPAPARGGRPGRERRPTPRRCARAARAGAAAARAAARRPAGG